MNKLYFVATPQKSGFTVKIFDNYEDAVMQFMSRKGSTRFAVSQEQYEAARAAIPPWEAATPERIWVELLKQP